MRRLIELIARELWFAVLRAQRRMRGWRTRVRAEYGMPRREWERGPCSGARLQEQRHAKRVVH